MNEILLSGDAIVFEPGTAWGGWNGEFAIEPEILNIMLDKSDHALTLMPK